MTILMFCGFTFATTSSPITITSNTPLKYDNMPTSKIINSTKEIQQIYDDINSTKYSKRNHLETVDGANIFSWGRIDVVDNTGYAYQTIVFICDGSDSYTKNFYHEIKQLSDAYSDNQNQIEGYLDLIRDNRFRNFGMQNYATIEKVMVTNTNGVQYEGYVVAICGSADFMEPYNSFYEKVIGEYHKNNI